MNNECFYQFDIYLVQEQFYQSIFLSNREQESLQFSSDDNILALSKQVLMSQKLNFGELQTDWLYKAGLL